jgi:hypothetical protein
MASFGAVAAIAATGASAFSPLETQPYTIAGASSTVTGLSASVSPNTYPGTGYYKLTFVTPSALTVSTNRAAASYIRIADANTAGQYNEIVSSISSAGAGVIDESTGYVYSATIANGYLASAAIESSLSQAESAPLIVYLGGSGTINAGDTLTLTFAASNPVSGSYTFYASTSTSTTWQASSNAVSIVASTGSSSLTASSYALNTGATYQISSLAAPVAIAPGTTTMTLQACQSTAAPCPDPPYGGTGTVVFSGGQGGYSVVDTTTGATLSVISTPSPVSGASTTQGGVVLQLSVPSEVYVGNQLNIIATGTNPSSNQSDYFVVTLGGSYNYAGPVNFGGTVTNLSLGLSTNTAGSSATYTASFNVGATGAMAPGGTITLEGPSGTTFANPSGAVVTDNTTGASQVLSGLVPTSTISSNDTITLSTNLTVSDNDTVTVQVYNVLNPAPGTYSASSGFSVKTSSDPARAYAPAYVIASAVASTSPTVSVSPNTAGALATYVIGTFNTASPLLGGTDTIEVLGPSGTSFPGVATLGSSTGSQTITSRYGAGTDDVTYVVATTVPAGASLTLTMSGTVNPPGGTYSLYLGADTEAANTTAAGDQGLVAPQVAPTTTTAPPTTTTTSPPARPVVSALTSKSTISNRSASLRLHCANAACRGTIKLWSHNILLAQASYGIGAGGTATFFLNLSARAMALVNSARDHVLGAGQTIFVDGGATVRHSLTLVGAAPPRPAVTAMTGGRTKVSDNMVGLRLHCANAACRGTIKLWSHNILLAQASYGIGAGGTATFYLNLSSRAMNLLNAQRGHVLGAGQTIFVDGGGTVRRGVVLVG